MGDNSKGLRVLLERNIRIIVLGHVVRATRFLSPSTVVHQFLGRISCYYSQTLLEFRPGRSSIENLLRKSCYYLSDTALTYIIFIAIPPFVGRNMACCMRQVVLSGILTNGNLEVDVV